MYTYNMPSENNSMEFVEHSVVINYIPVVYLLTVNVIEVTANAIILIPSGCPLSISECVFSFVQFGCRLQVNK